MKTLVTAVLLMFVGMHASAQSGNSDRCTVVMIEATGKNLRSLEKAKRIELGQFDTIVGEEDLTIKSYGIPKSSLFVVASVFYTDESIGTDSNRDSVSLQLSIQREAKRDLVNSLQYAEAEVMSPNFDVARVSTLVRIGKRSLIFVMDCDKKVTK